MPSKLSSLVDNLSEGLYKDKCIDCKSCFDYMMFKDDQLIFRCFECKKNYKRDFNKDLVKRFASIYEFCNGDINKFILLLRKGVYHYEYIDNRERFDETSFPDKEAFYSSLIIENIIDVDYRYAKRVYKESKVIIMIYMFRLIHYYLLMYLRILETNVLKYMNFILLIAYLHLD